MTQGTNEFAEQLKAEAAAAAKAERKQGGLKDFAASRGESYAINPYLIKIEDGWNSRDFTRPEVEAHIDDVARSIVAQGFLRQHPITTVWKNSEPYIRDGECRWRATIRAIEHYGASIKTVWAVTTDRVSSELDLLARQGLANLSLRFSQLEKANHYAKMLKHTTGGNNVAEVAAAVGVSETAVQRLLDLYSAPNEVKDLVRGDKVSVEVALDALKEAGGDAAKAKTTLEAAVVVAEINGAKRATAKHVRALKEGNVTVTRRKAINREEIRQIFAEAKIVEKGDSVAIAIDRLRFEILKDTFGF